MLAGTIHQSIPFAALPWVNIPCIWILLLLDSTSFSPTQCITSIAARPICSIDRTCGRTSLYHATASANEKMPSADVAPRSRIPNFPRRLVLGVGLESCNSIAHGPWNSAAFVVDRIALVRVLVMDVILLVSHKRPWALLPRSMGVHGRVLMAKFSFVLDGGCDHNFWSM